jgi:hypothetical protein
MMIFGIFVYGSSQEAVNAAKKKGGGGANR